MALAFTFPGQGSQAPGMGRDLAAAFPAAREVFQEVDETLKQKLSKLMFEGPAEELTLTANAQPALMAVSLAVLRVLEARGRLRAEIGRVALVAGHSLGEYSALAAADAFGLPTAARLLRLRGDSMQQAVPAGVGAMAALLGADSTRPRRSATPRPRTRTGEREVVADRQRQWRRPDRHLRRQAAVDRAMEASKAAGVKRAMQLPVSAPFHCALMAPAADAMAEALAEATMRAPLVPVVANVSAAKATDPAEIRDAAGAQVTATVRWRECIPAMAAMGCDRFVEIGAGRVLTGLMKRMRRRPRPAPSAPRPISKPS